ncbi:MarR family transcriptional regulator [Vibrio sp. CAU 1672]|uniref:MarR family winged helix-turn-helix transcriptional regulator n=1 Tax=Vibrio sp. CAU 1672 TaxID=3032594 RepID=UPI0023D9DDD8|nr:MarR family transcriptional regulator [Vibrio sp. CAU 1672]MDF2152236.1 MarR family transcriptional regulator [Vibrio sp. CAU 1672]
MDAIDKVVEQWYQQKPELETEPMAILGRLLRIAKHLETQITELHKEYDLKMGEFDVLATLRRSGEPYRLLPSELIASMLLTSGAMTNRLDKLEAKGLIARKHSLEDRRSVAVELTAKGLVLIDELMLQHVSLQHELLRPLTHEQKGQLNQLLKLWLPLFE